MGQGISSGVLLFDGLLRLIGPYDLVVGHDGLTLVVEDPLHSGLLDSVDEVFVAVSD